MGTTTSSLIISVSVSVVFVSLLINSSHGQSSSVENVAFSIDIPANWAYMEYSYTPEAKNTGFGTPNIIELTPNEFSDLLANGDYEKICKDAVPFAIFYQDTGYPKNALLESYVKYKINNYGFQNITSQQYTTVGKEKAVRIDANEWPSCGDSKFALYLVMHDSEPYVIAYSANEKNYEKYLPEFEQMVKSFRFANSPLNEIKNLSENENKTNTTTSVSGTSQPTFGQLDEFTKELDQQNKEKFLELGEEQFRKDCYKNLNSDNPLVGEIMKDMPKDMTKDVCENKISKIKNETATLQQNQILDSVTGETTYITHSDYSRGFTVEYPTDWNAIQGGKIFKGTREFTTDTFDDPKYSVLDTDSFGSMVFDVWKGKDGVEITDNLGRLMIGDEPALSFSYSQGDREFMVVALMHNNVGYVFEYGTLKENFDKDLDTVMHFFGTLRLS